MPMHVGIFGAAEIASEEEALDPLRKTGVRRHDVFEIAVRRAVLAHVNVAVLFYDLGLNLTGPPFDQQTDVFLPAGYGGAHFLHTFRAKRIRFAWEPQRGRGALIALEQRPRRPF